MAFVMKKFDGDDIYSYAIFKKEDVRRSGPVVFYGEARPIAYGMSKSEAASYLRVLRKKVKND